MKNKMPSFCGASWNAFSVPDRETLCRAMTKARMTHPYGVIT